MKAIETPGHRSLLLAGVVAVILAAAGGHLIGSARGRSDSRTKKSSSAFHVTTGRSANGVAEFRESVSTTSQESLEKIHQRLWKIWSETPDINADPEARAEIDRIVAGMSSQQIEEMLRTLLPGSKNSSNGQLRRIITYSWVLRDGSATMAYKVGSEDWKINWLENTYLVSNWITEKPDSALEWIDSLTPEQKRPISRIKFNAMRRLADSDPERFFQELSRMKPDEVADHLGIWHWNAARCRK